MKPVQGNDLPAINAAAVKHKYGGRTQPRIHIPDRQWPSRQMTECPDFLAVDLRDGNQALPKAMTLEQKLVIFAELVRLGFKEIELAFAGSSSTDFNFVRHVVDSQLAPDDVCIQVVSPCRKDAILNAVQSLAGAKKANIFLYIGCSDRLRETVLGLDEEEWLTRAVSCSAYARSLVRDGGPYASETQWSLSFAFEDFSNARIEPVARCIDAVRDVWRPTVDDRMVFCVAASVEVSTPNVFADRVEALLRQVGGRETFRFAVHPHNDRGCAVAAAELACLAGADRVDGCLFGHGERAGNVDLAVVAGNAMASGLYPGLDLTRLDQVARLYADITGIPVHPRTPYAGEFYFRAFSGLHQDSITKGLAARNAAATMARRSSLSTGDGAKAQSSHWPSWEILYLPVDPGDLGREMHDCVFGITSQSGKSGTAWVLKHGLGLDHVPENLLRQFSASVKELAEKVEQLGEEVDRTDPLQDRGERGTTDWRT
ncbi:2-isopropylmalate synthase [Diplocarpon rosae]|nr:2-isopropylmalate synthase [Diplocarpon rosae]